MIRDAVRTRARSYLAITVCIAWSGTGCGRIGFATESPDARVATGGSAAAPLDSGTGLDLDASVGMAGGDGAVSPSGNLAECLSLTAPNPDACGGSGKMTIDKQNTAFNLAAETAVFLRFEPIAGITTTSVINAVTLTLHLSIDGESGDESGEVWLVDCFARMDLFVQPPGKLGTGPIAPSLGNLATNSDATWSLPTTIVSPQQPICLGVFTSNVDGTDFDNLGGQRPPRLTVDAI